MLRIAIDVMGGDLGPLPVIQGTIKALREQAFHPILVGRIEQIKHLVPPHFIDKVTFVNADEVLNMSDSATDALKKKETSIYKAVELVRDNKADAVVSPGHSGATMSLATLRIGRLKGVLRPAIATIMPTSTNKPSFVLDVGANVDCKSEHLTQFAIMGDAYARDVLKIENPKVGLLSNGEEKSKGNEITKEAYKTLSTYDNFIGYVEGNNIFDGSTDVIVCDGFVGNILLKTSEGVAESITKIIKKNIRKSPLAIAGALLMRRVFKILKKQVDYAEYGGAPLIGIKGCAIVAHGKSNAKAIKNAIFQAISFSASNINEDIEEKIAQTPQDI
ncbi:MAG: phosphate acyltransferase PlsX [Epsilonproteobacteria bacterium]|nr:phosphate acyltransferase PlsX [Campylobacterota bacterium]